MKNVVWFSGAFALALMLVFAGSMSGGAGFATVASAQEATVGPVDGAQQPAVQTAQPVEENNDFPWGLLGLVGLAGLAGLRRQPEPTRQNTGQLKSTTGDVKPTVGVYDKKN